MGLRSYRSRAGISLAYASSFKLDQRAYLGRLIKQMITYAHHDGYTISHVAVYAVRYQRLRCLVRPPLNGLAGEQIDLATTAAELAEVI
jgi:hypothetical protein